MGWSVFQGLFLFFFSLISSFLPPMISFYMIWDKWRLFEIYVPIFPMFIFFRMWIHTPTLGDNHSSDFTWTSNILASVFSPIVLDMGLSGFPLHWYLCLLLLGIVQPISCRNIVTALRLGVLMSATSMWQQVWSMVIQLWCPWHFTSCCSIWVQMLALCDFGACGDILSLFLFWPQ